MLKLVVIWQIGGQPPRPPAVSISGTVFKEGKNVFQKKKIVLEANVFLSFGRVHRNNVFVTNYSGFYLTCFSPLFPGKGEHRSGVQCGDRGHKH